MKENVVTLVQIKLGTDYYEPSKEDIFNASFRTRFPSWDIFEEAVRCVINSSNVFALYFHFNYKCSMLCKQFVHYKIILTDSELEFLKIKLL